MGPILGKQRESGQKYFINHIIIFSFLSGTVLRDREDNCVQLAQTLQDDWKTKM